jgi:class 3 adenylate cyclase
VDLEPRSTGDDADVRSELRRYLAAEGVPAEIVAEYEERGWLTSAGADAVLHGAREYTTEEAAARAGISSDAFEQAYQAAGFGIPSRDVKAWSEEDVTLMFAFGAAAELFGLPAMLQFARVLGASLARLAEASVANFLVNVEAPLRQTHPEDDVEIARVNTLAVNMLMQVPTLSVAMFRRHVLAAQIRARTSRETEFDTFRLAVGFLDLVGFTELSVRLATSELAAAVEDFERDAVAVIATSGGRLVKSIGDELMFVAHSPDAACTVALELCEHVSGHPVLTELRGAVAFGNLLGRDGDYYGPTVNLAARALPLAPAGSIVTDRPIDGFTCRPLGPQQLRSIAAPVELWVLSR